MDLLNDWTQVQAVDANTMITGLSLDSRLTGTGDLFFAMQGLHSHGIEFCHEAIANGAAAIAWELDAEIKPENLPSSVSCIPISDLHQKFGFIASRFYHSPSEHMNVMGVTGTDGKTSVSQFIAQTFNHLNMPCGVIGTLGYGMYPNLGTASHTTPDAIRIQSLLHEFEMTKANCAVIEASSHGLKQGRLNGVAMNTAVFTNLGRDHMDYHPSLDDYADSKRILFQTPNLKHAVINIDDKFGCNLANELAGKINLVSYACDSAQTDQGSYIYADEILTINGKTKIRLSSSWGDSSIETNLYGKFNVSNLLATLGVLLVNGCGLKDAVEAVSAVHTVPGRMQTVTGSHEAPTVIVDFAHTPQALINVLQVLREQCDGKVWCVFGCGGDRDAGKRKLMASAVEQYSDYAIVTDDNPRTEDPERIAQNIISGFSAAAKYTLIHDRQKAIAHAINSAACEDTVLVAGKGHEAVQLINNRSVPFDDKAIAQTYLDHYQQ